MPEDYLLRIARQMGQLLGSILALRKTGDRTEAQAEVEKVCAEQVGLPWRLVRQASPEALEEHLRGAGALRHHRSVLLAELLMQEAEIAEEERRPADVIRARLQAFCLLSSVQEMLSVDDVDHYRPILARLAQQLGPVAQHPYLKEKLAAYHRTVAGPG